MSEIVAALKRTGLGFGTRGTKTGRYHTFSPPPPDTLTHITSEQPT